MRETFEHDGETFSIRRDDHGRAVDMDPLTPHTMTDAYRARRSAALASYLADAGDFASVRAAIADAPRMLASDPSGARAARVTKYLDEHPEVETTITTWKQRGTLADLATPLAAHAPVPAIGDLTGATCPSCDEPIILSTTGPMCPHCGARS